MTVRSLCDQAVWLENGVVRAIGKAGEVADAYLGKVQVDIQAEEAADPDVEVDQAAHHRGRDARPRGPAGRTGVDR